MANILERRNTYLLGIRKDILQPASTFLLLKHSKAFFTIEGERPNNGLLSKRARSNEFVDFADTEIELIQSQYQEIFG